MNKNIYLAKSDGEKLSEHTNNLLDKFNDFLSIYGDITNERLNLLVKIACEYHDLGKMNSSFQRLMYKKMNCIAPEIFTASSKKNCIDSNIPHGILSAVFISRQKLHDAGYDEQETKILVTAVVNHHNRSMNYQYTIEDINNIIDNDLRYQSENYGYKIFGTSALASNFLSKDKEISRISGDTISKYYYVKGMLNKLDYCASAHSDFFEKKPCNTKDMTLKQMSKFKNLRACQEFILDKQNSNIILTASTGMGKTEAGLIWAGDSKTFYTLPYKVSINAIFDRIKLCNYYDDDNIALLHSDAMSIYISESSDEESVDVDAIDRKYNSIKNLSYGLTVCTVDQLFSFVFKAAGTEMLLATLSYSKVIIDEIQSYSPDILANLLYGLYMINELGGKFLIITATLPPLIYEFLENKNIDIIRPAPFYLEINRHILSMSVGDFNYDEIVVSAKNKKVLIICNTVAKAQEVYNNLDQIDNVNLLHARFISKDKKEKEKAILEFSDNCDTGVWIATQIVEASLDIDFDILYTEMSSADSMLQRMGRCYRKREYCSDDPNILIYNADVGIKSIYDKTIFSRSINYLSEYENMIFSEEKKQEYINKVYNTAEIKRTDYYTKFLERYEELESLVFNTFKQNEAKQMFREIENISIIPFMFCDEAKEIFSKIKHLSKKERTILNDMLRNLSIQIPKKYLYNYKTTKYNISKEQIGDYYICNNDYNSDIGLIDYDEKSVFI